VKHRLDVHGNYYFFFSKVDMINEPALVIPTSLKSTDYQYKSKISDRKNVTFTAIPFGFLNRDDWLPNTNVGLMEIEKNFFRLPYMRKIWGSKKKEKNIQSLYQALRTTLLSNGNEEEERELNDDEAIEEYVQEVPR